MIQLERGRSGEAIKNKPKKNFYPPQEMSGFDSRKIEQLYACLDQREWKVGAAAAYS